MKIYVGNLSKQVTDLQLGEMASFYGTPLSVNVAVEKSSGLSKGFGFLEFNSDDEARAAIAGLNGRDVNGQILKVNESMPRAERAKVLETPSTANRVTD